MKIEPELRHAINAAAKHQPESNWQERERAQKASIEDFLKARPAVRKKLEGRKSEIEKIDAQIKVLKAKQETLRKDARKYGILSSLTGLSDSDGEDFVKAGGVIRPRHIPWKAEKALARIAAAKTPAERDVILKEYGINWA